MLKLGVSFPGPFSQLLQQKYGFGHKECLSTGACVT